MTPRAMVTINSAGAVAIASAFFWFGPDHSAWALGRWAFLLFACVIQPMRLSGRTEALLDALDGPVPQDLRRAASYPVVVGLMALLAGLMLIRP